MAKLDRGHLLLQDWAQYRTKRIAGLGYSSITTIGRVMESGLGFGGDFGPRAPNYDGDIMLSRFDSWLATQPTETRLLTVAWCHYVGKDGYGMRGESRWQAAGLSERTYFRTLSNLRRLVRYWRESYHGTYQVIDALDSLAVLCP